MYRAVSDVTRDENLMRQVTERQSFKDLMTDVYRLVEEDEARQAMDDEKPIDGDKPRLLLEGPVVDVGTAGVPPPAVESCGSEDPKSQSVMHLCERCGQEAAAAYDAKGHAGDPPKPDRRTQKMLELVWIMTITMAVAAGLINVGKIAFGERLAAYAWKTVTPAFVARFVRTP